MNDLETLHAALRAPAGEGFRPLDPGPIMAAGRRVRRRRRQLVAGTAAVVAVLAALGLAGVAHRPPVRPAPVGSRPAAAPTATPSPALPAWGDVIDGGPDGTVFYLVPATGPRGGAHLVQGHRDPSGQLVPIVQVDACTGCGPKLLFGNVTPPGPWLGFGYYLGPATAILAVIDDHRVAAHLARWSVDPNVVVFWFDAADWPVRHPCTEMDAFDATGALLARWP